MKNPSTPIIVLFFAVFFASCSTGEFAVRKNYHPRVKIEPTEVSDINYTPLVVQTPTQEKNKPKKLASIDKQQVEQKVHYQKVNLKQNHKKTEVQTPQKKRLSSHQKLNKTQGSKMDGTQVAGLVVSLIALCLAIASYMMIFWMMNGGLYAGFIVGLVLAAAAIAMGFIGGMLPFKGISWTARILGIIAVFVLMVFLVLIILGII